MGSFLLFLGLAFIIIGILIIMLFTMGKPGEAKTEVGVGGFIGPPPFGFATSKGMLILTVAISVAVLAFFLLGR